jgi:hypothetical protein
MCAIGAQDRDRRLEDIAGIHGVAQEQPIGDGVRRYGVLENQDPVSLTPGAPTGVLELER